jgi:4-hydroxy-tetrahydrodipicolinate synthase
VKKMSKMPTLKGIIAAMVTPMKENEDIDVDGIKRLTNRLVDAGVHGLFCLGTTGEFYALTDDEKELIVKTVMEETRGRVPVYAGTGGVSTRQVINLTKKLRNTGIAAVSVITPYFIAPNQEELYLHYKAIAESTDINVILYNIPMRTGLHLEADTVARLSHIKNIVGIKDSSGKFDNIKSYIDKSAKDFVVLAGTDSLIYQTLEAGGKGAIAATANVLPEIAVAIYNNFVSGDLDKAKAAQEKLKPLREAFSLGTAPGILKESVNQIGIPVGAPRMPVTRVTGEALENLKKMINSNYKDEKR